jgi:putative phage-type endonuclease
MTVLAAELVLTQEQIDADKDTWLKTRMRGVTASEIPSIAGVGVPDSWSTPYSLWLEKTSGVATEDRAADLWEDFDADDEGLPADSYDTGDMQAGRELEPIVAARFAATHPELGIGPGGLYRSAARPWQMATFDRLADDDQHVYPVQIKTSLQRHEWGTPGTDDIPDYYRAQCLWEMDVWDADLVYIPVLFRIPWVHATYVLRRDQTADDDITWLRKQAQAFLRQVEGVDPPPDVDWRDATGRAIRRLHPTVEDRSEVIPPNLEQQYRAAVNGRRAARKEEKLAINLMLQQMGNARLAVTEDGRKIASRSVSDIHRVNVKRLRDEQPAIAAAYTDPPAAPTYKLTPAWRGEI